ncbi:MAG: hypothetical protein ACW98Y_20725, partial [Candidatus Thorarchaeota archaeon]
MSISDRMGSVFVILFVTLLFAPVSLSTLSHDFSVGCPIIQSELSQSIPEEGPLLDYYLRNYSIYSMTPQQITLKIVAEDSDGVDSVAIMHRNSSEYTWAVASMIENPEIEGEYSTDFDFVFSELNLSVPILPPRGKFKDRHEVRYFANDS